MIRAAVTDLFVRPLLAFSAKLVARQSKMGGCVAA
jgi:hypothetical protein